MSTAYIVACTNSKRPGPRAAGLKYNGPHMRFLLNHMWEFGWPAGDQAAILSAKHGLLHLREIVDDYDLLLTEARVEVLAADPRQQLRMGALVGDKDRVIVAGGTLYRRLVRRLLVAVGYCGEVREIGGLHLAQALAEHAAEAWDEDLAELMVESLATYGA